jgi:hypothetical protein
MTTLLVNAKNRDYRLEPGEIFSFGRAGSCSCVLDPLDRGISRVAGAIVWESAGWWVVNRSSKRALHVVDAVGLSVPLPVARSGWPPSKRSVDPGGIRVLVAGDVWTHELRLVYSDPPLASTSSPLETGMSTSGQTPALTPARRLVLVALVSGYLHPFPRYDPQPRTYAEVSEMTGLPRSTVVKRIEAFRDQLRQSGVPGLEQGDARRPLSEWVLSTRLITPSDLSLLSGVDRAMDDTDE